MTVDVYDSKEYPKTLTRDDFWGQIRRTQNGKRITEEELGVIVGSISSQLRLDGGAVLLDLACGNGALSARLFDGCRKFLGVDYSDYLIGVANEFFAHEPDRRFVVGEADAYMLEESEPERFSRFLCYGAFAYFSEEAARTVLRTLRERFVGVELGYIGCLPDRDLAARFYPPEFDYTTVLSDHTAQIGIWRSTDEMARLALDCGWCSRFVRLPEDIFNSRYRYDVILTPA
jgi:SAM-dependent methyltransferase